MCEIEVLCDNHTQRTGKKKKQGGHLLWCGVKTMHMSPMNRLMLRYFLFGLVSLCPFTLKTDFFSIHTGSSFFYFIIVSFGEKKKDTRWWKTLVGETQKKKQMHPIPFLPCLFPASSLVYFLMFDVSFDSGRRKFSPKSFFVVLIFVFAYFPALFGLSESVVFTFFFIKLS